MPRRIAAIVCVAAGIFVLAGPGWALLALGVLIEVGWPRAQRDWRLTALGARLWDFGVNTAAVTRAAGRRVAGATRVAPLQMSALGTVAAGAVLVPAGMLRIAGLGAALVTLGVLVLALGLRMDRAA